MTIPFDTQLIKNEIAYSGDTVSITVISSSTYSNWGDATDTTTTTNSIKCLVNDVTPDMSLNGEGIFENAEKRFFFAPDVTTFNEGDTITYNSIAYRVTRIIKPSVQGTTMYVEAWGKRV